MSVLYSSNACFREATDYWLNLRMSTSQIQLIWNWYQFLKPWKLQGPMASPWTHTHVTLCSGAHIPWSHWWRRCHLAVPIFCCPPHVTLILLCPTSLPHFTITGDATFASEQPWASLALFIWMRSIQLCVNITWLGINNCATQWIKQIHLLSSKPLKYIWCTVQH